MRHVSLSIGHPELVMIVVIALVVFGPGGFWGPPRGPLSR